MTDARLLTTLTDRDDWLEVRRKGIGSSDAPAVLGWSPWTSPWALWVDKVGLVDHDEPTEVMEMGQAIEGFVLDRFTDRTGIVVARPQAVYAHPEHDWMLASPDALTRDGEPGLVEAKNVSEWTASEWRSGEEVDGEVRGGAAPAHYIAQVQHQHAVLGTTWGYLAALLGGNRLCIVEVPRDEEFISLLVDAEWTFWHDYVLSRSPPPMDGHDSTTEMLTALFSPGEPDSEIELSDEAIEALVSYRTAHGMVKEAEEAKRRAGNRLRHALGEYEAGTVGGVPVVRWKAPRPHRKVDVERLRTEHPEVAAKVSVDVAPDRRLDLSRSRAALAAIEAITDGGTDADHG